MSTVYSFEIQSDELNDKLGGPKGGAEDGPDGAPPGELFASPKLGGFAAKGEPGEPNGEACAPKGDPSISLLPFFRRIPLVSFFRVLFNPAIFSRTVVIMIVY